MLFRSKAIAQQAHELLELRKQYSSEQSDTRAETQTISMDERQYSQDLVNHQDRFASAVENARALGGGQFDSLAENMYESGKYQSFEQAQAAAAGVTLFDEMNKGDSTHRSMAESAFWESTGMAGEVGSFGSVPSGEAASVTSRAQDSVKPFASDFQEASHLSGPSGSGVSNNVSKEQAAVQAHVDAQNANDLYHSGVTTDDATAAGNRTNVAKHTNMGIKAPTGWSNDTGA